MRRLLIHCGLNKTGTSALQAAFHLNAQVLAEQAGVYYLKTGLRCAAHHLLSSPLIKQGDLSPLPKLIEEIQNLPEHSLALLSSEGFTNISKLEQSSTRLAAMNAELAGADIRIETLHYYRDPIDFFESSYAQTVFSARRKETLAKSFELSSQDNFQKLRFGRLFQAHDQIFGKDRVHGVFYDRNRFPQRDIVRDFFSRFGLKELPNHPDWKEKAEHVNPSLPPAMLEPVRRLGSQLDRVYDDSIPCYPMPALSTALIHELKPKWSGWRSLDDKRRGQILDALSDDFELMAARFADYTPPLALAQRPDQSLPALPEAVIQGTELVDPALWPEIAHVLTHFAVESKFEEALKLRENEKQILKLKQKLKSLSKAQG